jgi:transposase
VQACLEVVASIHLAQRGLSLEEGAKFPTPRFLGIDEFARRKGQRYDTILCDLEGRHVLEVSAGRKTDDVTRVLERLTDCDGVEALSMNMSRAFREAVQLCLPHACSVADHFHVIQHVGKDMAILSIRFCVTSNVRNHEVIPLLSGQRRLLSFRVNL